jgi:hypothetical protein
MRPDPLQQLIVIWQLSPLKASDIYRNCSCSLNDPEKTKAALALLRDYNIVVQEKQSGSVGRHAVE